MAISITNAAHWPDPELRRERSLSWIPDFQNQAGPQGLDGTRQYRNLNGGGLWRCAYNGEQLRAREEVMAWLKMEVWLRGGMNPVDVPLLFCRFQPKSVGSGSAPVIKATDGWAARAVTGRMTVVNSTPIEEGMHFSDYDATTYGWRLHRIYFVAPAGTGGGPDDYDIAFWPPARFAVAANHALEFEFPRCVMRLASSDSMDLELEQRKRGNPNAEFIEAF